MSVYDLLNVDGCIQIRWGRGGGIWGGGGGAESMRDPDTEKGARSGLRRQTQFSVAVLLRLSLIY